MFFNESDPIENVTYKMKKAILSLLTGMILLSCASEQTIPSKVTVKEVNTLTNATTNALVYSLPATVIRVEVDVEKTISKVGPFYRYSQKMLNVTDVVTEDKEEWQIKSVRIKTVGKPDDDKRFKVAFSGQSAAPFLNLTDDGILAGVNLKQVPAHESSLMEYSIEELPQLKDVNFNNVSMLEKQLVKTSTAAMAEEAANFIYKVRKRRFKIVASDYENLPPDGQSYEVSVRELNQLETDFMELFIGKKQTYQTTQVFEVLAEPLAVNNTVLFRFSTLKGIVDKMDLSGTPVYVEVEVDNQKTLPDQAINDPKNKVEIRHGLYYCRPAKARVKIIDRNILLNQKEVYLAQYGQVLSMPSEVLERDDVRIELNPVTGALKSISKE